MPSESKWGLWLLWVLASALGGAAVSLVARAAAYAAGYAAGEAGGDVLAEAATGAVALGGFMGMIGIAQWLVIMRQVSWAGWWVLANFVSGAVAGAVLLSVFTALGGLGEALSAIAGVVIGLSVFGIAQWLILRRQVSWAGWLALASTAGLVAAGPGSAVVGQLIGGQIGAGSGFGALYGAVTGGALVILSNRAAAPTPAAQESTT